jgi:hypothetical protein
LTNFVPPRILPSARLTSLKARKEATSGNSPVTRDVEKKEEEMKIKRVVVVVVVVVVSKGLGGEYRAVVPSR